MTIRNALNAQFLTILQSILLKVDGIKQQVAVQDGFIELDALIEGWMQQYGGKINIEPAVDAPANASWLARLVWALIDIDEPALIQDDRDIAAIVWPATEYPQYAGRTISWILGQEEMAGDPTATAFCTFLAVFLGPNHCENALNLKESL